MLSKEQEREVMKDLGKSNPELFKRDGLFTDIEAVLGCIWGVFCWAVVIIIILKLIFWLIG